MIRIAWTMIGACVALTAAASAQGGNNRGAEFVSQATCKLCHNRTEQGTQWRIWDGSPHRRAFETLLSEESKAIAKKLGLAAQPQEAAECLRCHVTSYDAETKKIEKALFIEDGIQCESCHGPGSNHVVDGRRYWMEKDPTANMAAHIVRPDQRACVQCHRRQSPTWDPARYTLANGQTTGFDFQQAFAKIAHPLQKGFLPDTKDKESDAVK